uniref:Uncharacterized protein n=1 Tax=Glossina palpalis gambiensis TaxID=67801 RepID=A0A1B0C6L1_9MUSC
MKSIGFWKENLKSYLIPYVSQAVGAFCKLNQDVTSWNHTEGAAVAIDAIEYERERDDCPIFYTILIRLGGRVVLSDLSRQM